MVVHRRPFHILLLLLNFRQSLNEFMRNMLGGQITVTEKFIEPWGETAWQLRSFLGKSTGAV